MELHAAGVWAAQVHHGWQQCEPHRFQQRSVTFLVSEEIKTVFLRLTEYKLFYELWWPEPQYITFPCHYKENNLKWAVMCGSWEGRDPVVEEQFSYFCPGVVPPNTELLLWAQLLQTHAWNSAFPRGGRWGWARDSLPADYCEVRSVDSDGRDASCWTPVTLSSRGSRLWTWTKVSEGVALCCNFRTTGCPSWWRLFKLRSTGCLCDKWIKRGCSGLHWDRRTHHGKLPVFPLQPSEALRADGRGERDLWVSPDSHLKDGSYSQIFSSPIFTHMFGLKIRDCFIASAALH